MQHRFVLLRVLCGILLATCSTLELKADTSNLTLRVMASNLTSGNFQDYNSPGLNILKGLKPDIVAMQEFNYSNNTPSAIRTMVDATFGTTFEYYRENLGYSIPNGIVSRYPIVDSGSWLDTEQSQPNRGFAWAKIQLPGSNYIYVVSVHLLTSGDRVAEATILTNKILTEFPPNAWVVVAGDFNTSSRTEAAMTKLKSILSDNPKPVDNNGEENTNAGRSEPYDYVLPSFSLTNFLTSVVLPSHTFPNGLVFDSRVYTPLSDVPPVVFGDSAAPNMQHMGVIKDFIITVNVTNASTNPPAITLQPQSQTVVQGSNATFNVTANGAGTLLYQWRFYGSNISGATASSYTRSNAQPVDAGPYAVFITNNIGSITSSIVTLTVTNPPPAITNQPQNQTVLAGQDVNFSVSATGYQLAYQWRASGTNIPGATQSAYTRTNAQTSDAGPYWVVITNTAGSITSSVATLSILTGTATIIAQWDFNTTNAGNLNSPAPSIGSGNSALIGGTTALWVSGAGSTDTSSPNSAWNNMNYPSVTTGNKTAGAQFTVSTAGREAISIRWDQRNSATGSKYARLQYTTNGVSFIDFPTPIIMSASSTFEPKTNNLASIPGVNNNPDFAFRIVSEFESSAINTVNSNYVGTSSSYGTGGTLRYDMLTVSGTLIPPPEPAGPATLSAATSNGGSQFQFLVTGTAGSNYIVQATADLGSNWVSLRTNASPFTFVDTNTPAPSQRFYRAIRQ